MAILGALAVLEKRLLLHSYLERPGGDRRAASGSLPVVRVLRKAKRLTPEGVLTLIETECLLRLKPARLVLAVSLGFALVLVPTLGGFALGLSAILGLFLNDLRISKQPPTCHVWRESLTQPFSVWRVFGTPGRAIHGVILLLFAFFLGLASLDWFGWTFLLVAIYLMLATVLLANAGYGLIQLHWSGRNDGFINDLNGAKARGRPAHRAPRDGPGHCLDCPLGASRTPARHLADGRVHRGWRTAPRGGGRLRVTSTAETAAGHPRPRTPAQGPSPLTPPLHLSCP